MHGIIELRVQLVIAMCNKQKNGSFMPILNKIDAKDFYINIPSVSNETGDIWLSLPSWGISRLDESSGIVITPACDLSQKKVETVMIIPIISISNYFLSKAFFFDIWTEVGSKIKSAGGNLNLDSRFENPSISNLNKFLQSVTADSKHASLRKQIAEYIAYINYTEALPSTRGKIKTPCMETLLGKRKYDEILKKMITNSYKSDIHFFPAFKNAGAYSAMQAHSLALFRHAYSVPIEILDTAQTSSELLWGNDQLAIAKHTPIAKEFNKWPVKASRLKDDFLSDLISRYLSMFMRLGSRDFTTHTIDSFASEIKEDN